MIYVLEGRCTHILLNEKYELKTGDLCILSPSLSHGLEVNNDSIVINILIRRGTIEDIFFNTLRDQNIISDFMRNSIYLYRRRVLGSACKQYAYGVFYKACTEI